MGKNLVVTTGYANLDAYIEKICEPGKIYSSILELKTNVEKHNLNPANAIVFNSYLVFAEGVVFKGSNVMPSSKNWNHIIIEAFHGPATEDKKYIIYINGNKNDIKASNLKWGTRSESLLSVRDKSSKDILIADPAIEIPGPISNAIENLAKRIGSGLVNNHGGWCKNVTCGSSIDNSRLQIWINGSTKERAIHLIYNIKANYLVFRLSRLNTNISDYITIYRNTIYFSGFSINIANTRIISGDVPPVKSKEDKCSTTINKDNCLSGRVTYIDDRYREITTKYCINMDDDAMYDQKILDYVYSFNKSCIGIGNPEGEYRILYNNILYACTDNAVDAEIVAKRFIYGLLIEAYKSYGINISSIAGIDDNMHMLKVDDESYEISPNIPNNENVVCIYNSGTNKLYSITNYKDMFINPVVEYDLSKLPDYEYDPTGDNDTKLEEFKYAKHHIVPNDVHFEDLLDTHFDGKNIKDGKIVANNIIFSDGTVYDASGKKIDILTVAGSLIISDLYRKMI